jgi:hypothetical protein
VLVGGLGGVGRGLGDGPLGRHRLDRQPFGREVGQRLGRGVEQVVRQVPGDDG